MRHPRSLSHLLCVLAALSLLAMPLTAGAAPAKKAPVAAKKVDKAKSQAAKKGWETRRINQKAESNWASRIAKNPKADKPGAREAFIKRSVAAQRGWQTRKAGTQSKSKKATGKKTAKKKALKKKAEKKLAAGKGAKGDKAEKAPAPASEPDMIVNAGVGAADFQKGIGKFDEARFAQSEGREMDAAVAQMHGHDAMAQSAYDTADAYEAAGKTDDAAKLRAFGDEHLARADAAEQIVNQMEEASRPGPIRRFFSFLNPFKKRNRGGGDEEVRVAGQ